MRPKTLDKIDDELWGVGFLELYSQKHDSHLFPGENRNFELLEYTLHSLNELRESRNFNEGRIRPALDSYEGHYTLSRKQLLDYYNNLDSYLMSIKKESNNRAIGGGAVSVMALIGVLLFIFAIVVDD